MKLIKKPWVIPIVLTFVILFAGGLYIGSLITKKEPLSESEIQSRLEAMYGGKVENLLKEKGIYEAELTRNGDVYSAKVDAITGSVLALTQTSKSAESAAQVISEADIQTIITTKYTGTTERISLNKNGEVPVYEVDLAENQKLKKVKIDALSGVVISETVKETTSESALISREQAIQIALGQLKGEVDHVSFEKTNDGGFYLIEIDGEEEEAVFQIHAISGKILSVEWDD